jgi:hypothetical protein
LLFLYNFHLLLEWQLFSELDIPLKNYAFQFYGFGLNNIFTIFILVKQQQEITLSGICETDEVFLEYSKK